MAYMAYMAFVALKFALLLLMNGRTGVSFMDIHLRQNFLILFLSGVHGWSVNPGLWVTGAPMRQGSCHLIIPEDNRADRGGSWHCEKTNQSCFIKMQKPPFAFQTYKQH